MLQHLSSGHTINCDCLEDSKHFLQGKKNIPPNSERVKRFCCSRNGISLMFFLKRKEKKGRRKGRKNLLVCFFSLEQQSRKRKAGMRVADSFFVRSKEIP